ncbi:MAG: hydrogen gas-evolving membrane-bound hydrogenase subunit E [Dehalococcoidia bacterium]
MRKIAIVVSLSIFIAFLIATAFLIHPFGYPPSQMDDYIIENTQSETGANSAVTAVVFDYRGFDTLGEATILFTAVTGVVMLFRKKKREE